MEKKQEMADCSAHRQLRRAELQACKLLAVCIRLLKGCGRLFCPMGAHCTF